MGRYDGEDYSDEYYARQRAEEAEEEATRLREERTAMKERVRVEMEKDGDEVIVTLRRGSLGVLLREGQHYEVGRMGVVDVFQSAEHLWDELYEPV